jgi:hypothetical protein
MVWCSRLKDLTLPYLQNNNSNKHDDGGGGGDHDDDDAPSNGNGLAVSRTKVCTQRKSHAAARATRRQCEGDTNRKNMQWKPNNIKCTL